MIRFFHSNICRQGGLLCAERAVPVFTYSRRRNKFYDIRNAPFAAKLPCEVRFSVEDCFRMAGGSMRTGRVDNGILSRYLHSLETEQQAGIGPKQATEIQNSAPLTALIKSEIPDYKKEYRTHFADWGKR